MTIAFIIINIFNAWFYATFVRQFLGLETLLCMLPTASTSIAKLNCLIKLRRQWKTQLKASLFPKLNQYKLRYCCDAPVTTFHLQRMWIYLERCGSADQFHEGA